jgi:type VI protein secretion system component Hcp
MGHHYQRKVEAALARKHHPHVFDSDSRRSTQANAIMKLHNTIGNKALQRLIGGADQSRDASTLLQRAPDARTQDRSEADSKASLPTFLAKFVLQKAGEIKGKSRIPGHEGKLEILSLNFGVSRPTIRRQEGEEEPEPIRISVTRYVDDVSQTFLRANHDGDPVLSLQLELIQRDDDGKVQIAKTFTFSDGIITSYSVGGDGGGQAVEVIELEFKKGSF